MFIVCGIGASVWGSIVILRARRSLRWPTVEGVIDVSELNSDADDLVPKIEYLYKVAGADYRAAVVFPTDISPTQEFASNYLENYPRGAAVTVYYDPLQPSQSTLEPGMGRGDWLILALGLAATITGLILVGGGLWR